jgi:hypothetical protein
MATVRKVLQDRAAATCNQTDGGQIITGQNATNQLSVAHPLVLATDQVHASLSRITTRRRRLD